MPRPRKHPDYNADLAMQEFLEAVSNAFGTYDDRDETISSGSSLTAVALEFGITALSPGNY